MIRPTLKTLLTNLNSSYIVWGFLGAATFFSLFAPRDVPAYNLLASIGLVVALWVGVHSGTTLAEIKVKPVSFGMPRQEKSLAVAVLLVGGLVCSLHAILLAFRPLTVIDTPPLQQSLSAFGFGLALYMLTVTVLVLTRDTRVIPSAGWLVFLLLVIGLFEDSPASRWISLSAALAQRPALAVFAAAVGVGAAFHVLLSRDVSRSLCGAPFIPLKAYDNPLKGSDYRRRIQSASFRPGSAKRSPGGPIGAVSSAFSRRFAGTSWDYLVLETRASSSLWEQVAGFAGSLVILAVFVSTPGFVVPGNVSNPSSRALSLLLFLVVMTFSSFPPVFKPRVSPMLPVSRRRHFKAFLAKALAVYGFAILTMLLLRLVMESVRGWAAWPVAAIAEMPVSGVLLVSAVMPLLCWMATTFRSMIASSALLMLFFLSVNVLIFTLAGDFLANMTYPTILSISAACWAPFLFIAWKRCFRDDLTR